MPTIGTYQLIKNERPWIGAHLARTLDYIDQAVFFDGNSTDGTLEILKAYAKKYPGKVIIKEDMDPKDLRDDYVRMFDACMRTLTTDYAWFIHPDMIVENPEQIRNLPNDAIALSCHLRSFAGEPNGQLYEVKTGRADQWQMIHRLHNPDLGAHYWGHYGSANEGTYFRAITGHVHVHHGPHFGNYPYPVIDSGIKLLHFSDVRSYERRLGRMKTCLLNQGYRQFDADRMAPAHPRVTLKNGGEFTFEPAEYPEIFKTWEQSLKPLGKRPTKRRVRK